MVDFLNDDVTFEGEVTTNAELIVNGGLIVGPGGAAAGEVGESWPAHTRVQVADVTERTALVAWRAANDPISATRPLLVWRADGSLTGVNEITVDGVNWFAESPLSGDIEMTMATAAPYGWLLCQGQVLANAAVDYPALWAAASTAYRVGGSLRLPDLRGRVPMGSGTGPGLTLRNIGDAVGSETVVLTEAQIPAHRHTETQMLSPLSGAYAFDVYDGGSYIAGGPLTPLSGSTGGGQGHPNVPPAAIVNFKVKI